MSIAIGWRVGSFKYNRVIVSVQFISYRSWSLQLSGFGSVEVISHCISPTLSKLALYFLQLVPLPSEYE